MEKGIKLEEVWSSLHDINDTTPPNPIKRTIKMVTINKRRFKEYNYSYAGRNYYAQNLTTTKKNKGFEVAIMNFNYKGNLQDLKQNDSIINSLTIHFE